MHYDLETMGKYFTAVDENSGIYMRNGVFYATVDLAGKKSLQPVGIANGKAEGLSESLSEEQKQLFEKFMGAMKKMEEGEKLSIEEAQKKFMELIQDPEKLAELKEEKTEEEKGAEPPADKKTHGSK